MRLAAELGYGLNAFCGYGTMTPFLGTRSRSASVPVDHTGCG